MWSFSYLPKNSLFVFLFIWYCTILSCVLIVLRSVQDGFALFCNIVKILSCISSCSEESEPQSSLSVCSFHAGAAGPSSLHSLVTVSLNVMSALAWLGASCSTWLGTHIILGNTVCIICCKACILKHLKYHVSANNKCDIYPIIQLLWSQRSCWTVRSRSIQIYKVHRALALTVKRCLPANSSRNLAP